MALSNDMVLNILNVKAGQKSMTPAQYLAALGITEADWLADPNKWISAALPATAPAPAAVVAPATAPAPAAVVAPAAAPVAVSGLDLAVATLRAAGIRSIELA